MFFLRPNFNLANAERKTGTIVAFATSVALLVVIGGLIGLARWLFSRPNDEWVVSFTTNPAGIIVIIACGVLWTYIPELLDVLSLGRIYLSWTTIALAYSPFAVGILIMALGYKELYKLYADGIWSIVAILISIVLVAPRIYQLSQREKGKLPPPPRSHKNHLS